MTFVEQPNIILVYSDQLRFDALSANGHKLCKTPNIDSLIAGGVSFENAYNSYPLCCPFRASLITGQYAHTNGMYSNHYPLSQNLPAYLPQIISQAGYKTAWIGKWHLSGGGSYKHIPKEYWFGFDEMIGFSAGHRYTESTYYINEDTTPHKTDRYEPEYQTEHMIDFIDRAMHDNQPFMGMVCYGIPHGPGHLQPDKYKQIKADDITLVDTVPLYEYGKAKQYNALYYNMVNSVDVEVGKLIKHLKSSGIFDNTIFIFVSDHGTMCGEYGMYQKSNYYSSSTHVPFIISYPKNIAGGVKNYDMIDPAIDIAPTILDLCNIEIPHSMQGQSLKKLLYSGIDSTLRDYVYYEIIPVDEKLLEVLQKEDGRPYAERGFRTKDVLYAECNNTPFAYYNTQRDPQEKYNLAFNIQHIPEVLACRERLKEIMQDVCDDWSLKREQLPICFLDKK